MAGQANSWRDATPMPPWLRAWLGPRDSVIQSQAFANAVGVTGNVKHLNFSHGIQWDFLKKHWCLPGFCPELALQDTHFFQLEALHYKVCIEVTFDFTYVFWALCTRNVFTPKSICYVNMFFALQDPTGIFFFFTV